MNTYQPFIYIIGWTELNTWYLGCKYAKGCQPLDLWTTYFTSSKIVEQIRDDYGEPDVVDVLCLGHAADVRELEHVMILEHALHKNPAWLNRGSQRTIWQPTLSDEHCRKIGIGRLGIKMAPKGEAARRNVSERNRKRWSDPECAEHLRITMAAGRAKISPAERREMQLKRHRIHEYNSQMFSIGELSEIAGVGGQTMRARLKAGMSPEEAVTLGKNKECKRIST